MSTLVTYFSAEGTTAKVAKEYAEKIGADLFEIVPEVPYSTLDIRWVNPLARCNREQIGGKDVPVSGKIDDFGKYDTVYIGFPIWYGQAPRVVHTFCKGYDWTGKDIHIFATSGGSGIGKTAEKLQPSVAGGNIIDAKRISSASEI
ncbi:flavodoxin [Oribacterium sp. NK2B42]|uniref:flavodoxin n=1 Tax=Oribacterium sp. NK2B42 TaxID=689781 RepID=UPI0003FF9E13|nr:flavodoxin [Oribacterium sp. NK2B42]